MAWLTIWFQWAEQEPVSIGKPLLLYKEEVDNCPIDTLLLCLAQSLTYKGHPIIFVK